MPTRRLAPLGCFVAAFVLAGCSASPAPSSGTAASDIVDVPHTPLIENQALENCWIYATTNWAESMHKAATHEDFNGSESYWTYLDWFVKLTGGHIDEGGPMNEFGSFSDAAWLIKRYGIMAEKDFIPSDVPAAATVAAQTSRAQAAAEKAINASLKDGPLSHSDPTQDVALVRQELDKAFGLSDAVKAAMTKAFGPALDRTFVNGADATGTAIVAPTAFAVAYTPGPGKPAQTKTLLDAATEWHTVSYRAGSRRAFEKRFQRALHDRQPVVMSWFIDFAYADNAGRVILDPAHPPKPTIGGGHVTVMQDYQATDVPGFGTLKAGVLETRPAALAAALDDAAKIELVRIKNSWGTRPTDVPNMPGYYDLYTSYLEATIPECDESFEHQDGGLDASRCPKGIPFQDVSLPPGY